MMERPEERMIAAAPEMYEYVRICTNEPVKFSVYRHNFVQYLQAFICVHTQFCVQACTNY